MASLYIVLLLAQCSLANYFCNLNCKCKMNTACKREPCRCTSACGSRYKMIPLDDTSRQWVLDVHNELRNKLALGEDTRGGNSAAANMRALSYSKEIEFVAQCHANACVERGVVHDACRSTSVFSAVGQNMYGDSSTDDTLDYTEKQWIDNGVNAWYDEIELMNDYVVDSYQNNGKKIGHFTQVVWAKTTHIGCGRVIYSDGIWTGVYLYCNYGTGGNMMGAPLYIRGDACSQCDSDACNEQYPGLCGKISNMSEDNWVAPFQIKGDASHFTKSLYSMLVPILVVLCVIM